MKLRIPDLNWKIWAALGGGAFLFFFRKQAAEIGGEIVDAAKQSIFSYVIPSAAQPYSDVILQVASEQSIDPLLITALGEQETQWTTAAGYSPKGDPRGTGDAGHGHGIMQIDDRTWGDWLASHDWGDPYTNITKGVQILKQNLAYFAGKGLTGSTQLKAALAAYNHGPGNVWANIQANRDIDYGTSQSSVSGQRLGYSASVLTLLASLTDSFNAESATADASAVSGWQDGGSGRRA